MSKKAITLLGLLTLLTWIIMLAGRGIVAKVVGIYYFDLPPHPYFQPSHALTFYILTPLVVFSSIVLWMLPGIFLTLAVGKTHRFSELITWGFGFSFISYAVILSIIKLVIPGGPSPDVFLYAVIASSALSWGWLTLRVYRGASVPWPFENRTDIRRLAWSIAIPIIVLLMMFPLFFWQDMHGDGFEALEMGRSLSQYILPRSPGQVGLLGLGIGMLPMAFPVHWFVALFGPVEASARFPILLYLPIVFCLVVDLVEWRLPRMLGVAAEGLVAFALGIYTIAMGMNASYDPYFADLAAPAAFETLTILCMLATIIFLWRKNWAWFFFFAILSYLCRPNGLMLLGLLALAVFFIMPDKRKRWLAAILTAMACCIIIAMAYDKLVLPWVSGSAVISYGSESLLDRIRYIRWIEPYRLNFGLFPTGIIPFLSLFFFKWQDRYARMISIVALLYFGLFFFFAYIAMHHFVPAMILPLVVFWRIYLNHPQWNWRLWLPLVAVVGAISLWVSLPRNFEINRSVRKIGEKTSIQLGDYIENYSEIIEHENIYKKFIRPDWSVKDRSKELVSTPAAVVYYATRPKRQDKPISYIIQSQSQHAPGGFTQVAADETTALYVKDINEWKADRFQELNTDFVSAIYRIPRGSLFYFWDDPHGTKVIDLMKMGGVVKRAILGLFH